MTGKVFRYHPRLWIALGGGAAAYLFLPADWAPLIRLLTCWNCGVILFLGMLYAFMTRLSAAAIRSRYVDEDGSAPVILFVVVVAAVVSVLAIVQPLATLRHASGAERLGHITIAAVTLVNSWLLVPTMFTTHYADMFYSANEDERPLLFPGTPMPAFWDFAYFSFTIAAACQTSDVSTTNIQVRKVVIIQTLVSFFFNASILGFAINVTAGLIGG